MTLLKEDKEVTMVDNINFSFPCMDDCGDGYGRTKWDWDELLETDEETEDNEDLILDNEK